MKKLFAVLTAVLSLACATVFTSCDEPLIAEENTWYRVDKEIGGVNVRAYLYYTQKEVTIGNTVLKPGITMAVTPSSISAKFYGIKTFEKSDKKQEVTDDTPAASLRTTAPEETTEEGEEESEKTDIVGLIANGTTMDAFLVGLKKANIDYERLPAAPIMLDPKGGYETVDSLKELFGENITWKDLVKGIINSVL